MTAPALAQEAVDLARRVGRDAERSACRRYGVPLAEVTDDQAEQLLVALRRREAWLADAEAIARTRPGSAERDELVTSTAARLGVAPCDVWCRYADARAAGEVTRYVWPAGGGEPVKVAQSDPPLARAHARGADPAAAGEYDPFASLESFADWKAARAVGDRRETIPHGRDRNRDTPWSKGDGR